MRPIQELHKADAIWWNARKNAEKAGFAKDYSNFINRVTEEESSPTTITFDKGLETKYHATELPLSVVNDLIAIIENYYRGMAYSSIDMLAELGYEYNPFETETQTE
jgi:hypothetical protein